MRRQREQLVSQKCPGNENQTVHVSRKKTAKATRSGRIFSRPLRTSSAPSSVYFIYCETREWMMTSASDEKLPAARRQ